MDQLSNINNRNGFNWPNQLGNVGPREQPNYDYDNWSQPSMEELSQVNVPPAKPQVPFGANLVKHISSADLQALGLELKELVKADWESGANWRKILDMALEYLGIGNKGTSGKQADALGNSDVFSGTFLEVALKGTSQLILDYFSGDKIGDINLREGFPTSDQDEAQADQLAAKINYFLNNVDEGFVSDKYTAGMWLIVAGCIFDKTWYDPVEEMVLTRYVKPNDMIVDFSHSSLHDCPRISHRFNLGERDYNRYVESSFYRKVDLTPNATNGSAQDGLEKRTQQMDGVKPSQSDLEKNYTFIESQCYYSFPDLDGEKRAVPYRVTYEEESGQIVAVYFDWKEGDQKKKRKKLWTLIQYLPGFGLCGYGQAHIALNFAILATNLLRETVTGAKLANYPYAYVSDDVETPQSTVKPVPGELIPVKTLGTSNLAQLFYSPPFKDPSQVIIDLIAKAENQISSLSMAATMKIEDLQTTAPVGTTLALLMEWHKLPSSIMLRIYRALCQEFKLIYETMQDNLPRMQMGQAPAQWGPYQVYADEFLPSFEFVPIVDPNMTSTTLKVLMYDKLIEMSQTYPDYHNTYELLKGYYTTLKIPNMDEVLVKPADPTELTSYDPVTENALAMEGKPIHVDVTDDHPAHIEVHQAQYEVMSQDQNLSNKAPVLHAHIVEHMAQQYLLDMQNKMGFALPQADQEQQATPAEKNQIAMLAAQVVAQQQAATAQATPPDPALIQAQAEMLVAQAQAEQNKLRHEIDLLKTQLEEARLQQDARIEELKAQSEAYKVQANMIIKNKELGLKEQEFLHKIGASPGEQEVKNLDQAVDETFIPHP